MITPEDKELLAKRAFRKYKSLSSWLASKRLSLFEVRCCICRKGILAPDAEEQKAYLAAWDAYTNSDKTIVKFVPASVLPAVCSRIYLNFWMLTILNPLQSSNKLFESIENLLL